MPLPVQRRPTGDRRADLRDLGLRMHAGVLARLRTAALSSYRMTGRAYGIQAVGTSLGVLRGAGFAEAEAVRIYHGLVDQAPAHGALDSASAAMPQAAREAEGGGLAGDVRAAARRHPPAHRRQGPADEDRATGRRSVSHTGHTVTTA